MSILNEKINSLLGCVLGPPLFEHYLNEYLEVCN